MFAKCVCNFVHMSRYLLVRHPTNTICCLLIHTVLKRLNYVQPWCATVISIQTDMCTYISQKVPTTKKKCPPTHNLHLVVLYIANHFIICKHFCPPNDFDMCVFCVLCSVSPLHLVYIVRSKQNDRSPLDDFNFVYAMHRFNVQFTSY